MIAAFRKGAALAAASPGLQGTFLRGTCHDGRGLGSCSWSLEGGMDGDKQEKSAIEKMVDKINDAVENLVNTASEAAMKALEPETPKSAAQPIASLPLAGDGLVSDPLLAMPPVALAPAAAKRAAPKQAARKSAKKPAGKAAYKAPRKSAAKSGKKSNKAS